MRRSARRQAKSAAGRAGWVVASATAKAPWRRWPLCERRARAGRRKYGSSIRRGGGIVLAHVTNDHGAESNRSAPVGSGKRRAGLRLPEQARGKHSCSPAHARGRASDEAMNGSTPLYSRLAEEWSAKGAAVPCRPAPLWQLLVSFEHFRRETSTRWCPRPGCRQTRHSGCASLRSARGASPEHDTRGESRPVVPGARRPIE